jgi:hypothetical protein
MDIDLLVNPKMMGGGLETVEPTEIYGMYRSRRLGG